MPGIAGLVTRMPAERAKSQLALMLGTMHHETFYVTRTFVDADLGVYVGWTAIRGSSSDSAELSDAARGVSLIFSGEEYSPTVSPRSPGVGSRTDLVDSYKEDPAFPARLNGRFHGLVVDAARSRVLLFNDRYGMHRLHWHESREGFYFAAEAKAILAVCPDLRRLSAQGLAETVALGCVMENRTLFDAISLVPGGSAWIFENGILSQRNRYFNPLEWEQQPQLEPAEFYRQLKEVFTRILPRYFEGHERIGMSLTGGLDTRMIMAWQQRVPGTLPCYTFAGPYRECQDVRVARAVAAVCRQPFTTIDIGDEFLKQFPAYAERAIVLSDGCVDARMAADLYVNEKARLIAPVRMTGLYGGEVLRRVRAFKPVTPHPGLFPALAGEIERTSATYADAVRAHPLSFAVFRQAPWHHYNTLGLEQTQVTMRSPFLDNEFVQTVFRAPTSATVSDGVSMKLIADGHGPLAGIPTDRGLDGSGSIRETLANAYQEFTFKAEYAYDYGMPQWVAGIDHLLKPLRLQRLFLGRHKMMHYRTWYREPLAHFVREVLLDPKSLARPYLNKTAVEHIVGSHTRGVRNYTTEIHRLLRLEFVCRNFIDQPARSVAAALRAG